MLHKCHTCCTSATLRRQMFDTVVKCLTLTSHGVACYTKSLTCRGGCRAFYTIIYLLRFFCKKSYTILNTYTHPCLILLARLCYSSIRITTTSVLHKVQHSKGIVKHTLTYTYTILCNRGLA